MGRPYGKLSFVLYDKQAATSDIAYGKITVMKNSILKLASIAALASCLSYLLPLAQPLCTVGRAEAANNKLLDEKSESKKEAEIYTFKAKALDGQEIKLSRYKGDVMLIVNTASQCGFTPQYQGLEALNKKYGSRGLKVLGFPCNQFGAQEPGGSKEIATFCKKNYGVDFQMFEKIDVNGKDADPIYRYLTSSTGDAPIKWNFTKFLIDRKGKIVKRFDSAVKPEEITADIEKQL
jgi:glutathione peroxidase